MRLKPHEISAIKAAANDVFGPNAVVRLFGSRVRDDVKGGDIDLHFELTGGRPDAITVGSFRWKLMKQIGERCVDLIFHDPGTAVRPIDRVAHAEGIVL